MKFKDLQYKPYRKGIVYVGDHYKRKKLSKDEMKELMKSGNALYIRNIYSFDQLDESNFWHIIQDHFYDIDELQSKSTRKNLRKSLSVYDYKVVDKNEILKHGYRIYCETAIRLNIKPSWSEKEFIEYVNRVYDNGGEFWIGYHIESGEPAMWESILKFDNHIIMDTERLSYKFTKHNPTYGLNYKITEYYLKGKGYKYIDAGAKSLTEHSNVQNFLIDKFQFRKAYCQLQSAFNPKLNALIYIAHKFKGLFKRHQKLNALINLYEASRND